MKSSLPLFLGALMILLAPSCEKPEQKPDQKPEETTVSVISVSLSKPSLALVEGESATLTATVLPDNATDKSVIWESSAPAVATVDQEGRVTAVAEGSATVSAKAGTKTAYCTVTVSKRIIAVESLTLSQPELSLVEGESATLTATVLPEDATDKSVSWESSAPSVATVDQSGNVTAVAEGSAVITAKAGEQTATCAVTVSRKVIPVESVTLDKPYLSVYVGGSASLEATIYPSNATDKTIVWSSSEPSIATVSDGVVTGVAVGTAVITASSQNGKTATCEVTVSPSLGVGIEGYIIDEGIW